jgi:cytochrome c
MTAKMQIKKPKAPALSVLMQAGSEKMLNKSLLFLSRHSGFLPLPPGQIRRERIWSPQAPQGPGRGSPATKGWGEGVGVMAIVLIANLLNPVFAGELQGPKLGQPASKKEIAPWEIGIMPDGEGLPKGKGTAKEGRVVYEKYCASCHGPDGSGGTADALAGATMGLTSEYPEKTIGTYWPYATTLFDMTRRSMPTNAPGTLSNDEVYAVTAYMLYLNKIIGEKDQMNAKTLPQVKMPNREGFINVYEQEEGIK